MKKLLSLLIAVVMVVTMLTPLSVFAEETIVTVDDSGCKFSGSGWQKSTNEKVLGPKGGYSWYTVNKDDAVQYAVLSLKGSYGLFVYQIIYGTTTDNVEVTVAHNGQTKMANMNFAAGKTGWTYLGKYDFKGDAGEFVKFQIARAGSEGGCQRAAAVKFVADDGSLDKLVPATISAANQGAAAVVAAPTEEITYKTLADGEEWLYGCDTPGFSKVGSWVKSSLIMPGSNKGYYTSGKGNTATWFPYLNKAEGVKISYLKVNATGSEDAGLKIEVFAEGKTTEIIMDFTKGKSGWASLGEFNFSGDGSEYVKVTKVTTSGTSRATLLKFSMGVEEEEEVVKESILKGTNKEILERLGMLLGEGNGVTEQYLASTPTRVQAAILVLRLRGLEKAAAAFTGTDNFDDVGEVQWAAPYLAYIKAHPELGMTGVGDNKFEPSRTIGAQEYAKILLNALGYKSEEDFTWDGTLNFASSIGLTVNASGEFTISKLADATALALGLKIKGSDKFTLLGSIISQSDGIVDTAYANATGLPQDLKDARTAAKNKKRGLIYNNDGNDVYKAYDNYPGDFDVTTVTEPKTYENFLSKRTTGLDKTQATSIFYCTGVFDSYTHRSSGETSIRHRDWSWELADMGKDTLETMIDYGKQYDKEVFWSMRMNDTHDAAYQEDQLDPWKKANLDKLMARKEEAMFALQYGGSRWSSVNYGLQSVRQKVYNILKDVVVRYDVDGLELDFTRFLVYFKEVMQGEKVYPESVEKMNNLMRAVRTMTEQISIERGKPILVSIYVPDSIGYCYELGLDIKTWIDEDLIDMVAAGGQFRLQSWQDNVEEYKNFDVPFYAAFDPLCYDNNVDFYQEAASAWAAGVDGTYIYNIFNPNIDYFRKLGSPETTGPCDPSYVTKAKTGGAGIYFKGGETFVKDLNKCSKK